MMLAAMRCELGQHSFVEVAAPAATIRTNCQRLSCKAEWNLLRVDHVLE